MNEKLQYLLNNYYDSIKIKIEVKNKDIRKYEIVTTINFLNNEYESNFIYTYDVTLTVEENVDNIKEIIDKEIILDFYKR